MSACSVGARWSVTVCAALLLVQGLSSSPARAQVCTQVEIQLPDSIVLRGDHGNVHATVQTDLLPGRYKLRYLAKTRRLQVSPWQNKQTIIAVSVQAQADVGQRYQAYVKSMRQGGA